MKELKVIRFLCFILGECSGLHTREWMLMSEEVRLWPHGKGVGSQSQSIRESIVLGGRWQKETYLMLKTSSRDKV